MAPSMGHRTTRVQNPRATTERTAAPDLPSNPPSPKRHARINDERETDLIQVDVQNLRREFTKLQANLNRSEEITDGIRQMLIDLGIRVPPRPQKQTETKTRRLRMTDEIWEILARPGIGQLHFGEQVNGSAPVSIDGAKEFMLTAAAADLAAVLAADERRAADGFPPFRLFDELVEPYSARRGRAEGVRAVIVGLIRLREQLLFAGNVTPGYVEVRDGRVRLRIRRPAK
jgi:hypothetical protein